MNNAQTDKEWDALLKAMGTDHVDDWSSTAGWGGRMPARHPKNDLTNPLVVRWNAYIAKLPKDVQAKHAATRRLLDARTMGEMSAAIADGADVNVYSGNYKYPRLVLEAACMGDNERVRMLAEAGANLEIGSPHTADTALSVADMQGRYETMHLLLEMGSDPNSDFVLRNQLSEASDWCTAPRAKIIQALIRAGGRVESRNLEELRDTKPDVYSRMDDEGEDIYDLVLQWLMEANAKRDKEALITGLGEQWKGRSEEDEPGAVEELRPVKRRLM